MAHGFEQHDHTHCIKDATAAAEAVCAAQGLKFTPIRRRVLEILLTDHRALGAYEILDRLTEDGQKAQPPVAYRALDFLVQNGLAHRIERLNAYTACTHADRNHVPAFLICRDCRAVAETETALAQGRLGVAARESGFVIEKIAVEAEGLCPACAGATA